MRILKRALIISALIILLVACLYYLWILPRYVVPILMYHHFGHNQSTLFVTPENFNRQMEYLHNKGYKVISLDELVEGIKSNKRFDRKTVVITIDDGYKNNHTYAYPVLKKYGFPATIFIVANFIDNKDDFLTWNEIRAMSLNAISFGGHTKNNVYLPEVTDKETLWEETAGCKKLIEENLGKPIDYFCYPTGGFTEEVKVMLKKAGFKGACTTNRGFAELNKDIYELKRVKVTNSDTTKLLHFWAKLSGYYNLFRSQKRGY